MHGELLGNKNKNKESYGTRTHDLPFRSRWSYQLNQREASGSSAVEQWIYKVKLPTHKISKTIYPPTECVHIARSLLPWNSTKSKKRLRLVTVRLIWAVLACTSTYVSRVDVNNKILLCLILLSRCALPKTGLQTYYSCRRRRYMCCAPNRSLLQTGPICCEQLELFAKPKNSIIVLLTYPSVPTSRYSTGTLPVGYTGTLPVGYYRAVQPFFRRKILTEFLLYSTVLQNLHVLFSWF